MGGGNITSLTAPWSLLSPFTGRRVTCPTAKPRPFLLTLQRGRHDNRRVNPPPASLGAPSGWTGCQSTTGGEKAGSLLCRRTWRVALNADGGSESGTGTGTTTTRSSDSRMHSQVHSRIHSQVHSRLPSLSVPKRTESEVSVCHCTLLLTHL